MKIEPATLSDCRAVAAVQVESWRQAYRELLPGEYLAGLSVEERAAMWRRMVERQEAHLWVARDDGEIIGFIAFGKSRDADAPGDCAEVWAIYVKPSRWSTGAGRQLWQGALQQIREEGYTSVTLWVMAGNARAIRFYERAGFVAEPGSHKQFELGGTMLDEVRYVFRVADIN